MSETKEYEQLERSTQSQEPVIEDPVMSFLIAWGVGGCWSGFTHAKIIEATGMEEAQGKAIDEALIDRSNKGLAHKRGCSADAELIETTVEDTGLFSSRLKSSAIAMVTET